jgi:hypothetical protein
MVVSNASKWGPLPINNWSFATSKSSHKYAVIENNTGDIAYRRVKHFNDTFRQYFDRPAIEYLDEYDRNNTIDSTVSTIQ